MTEQQIQKKIIDYLESLGAYVFKVIKANRAGVADIIACMPLLNGRLIGIEVKRKNGKVSPLQKYHIDLVNKAGGISFIAYSLDEVRDKLSIEAPEIDW